MDSTVRRVFDYYFDIALHMGRKGAGADEDAPLSRQELAKSQGPFSVADFYEAVDEHLDDDFLGSHELLAAFLGDATALKRIRGEIGRACGFGDTDLAPFFSRKTPLGSDVDQLEVVRRSLTQPFTIVQGPPGTGKTQVIANVVSCIQGLCHGKGGTAPTIAIVSANKDAVGHALQAVWNLTRTCDDEDEHPLAGRCGRFGNRKLRSAFVEACREKLGDAELEELGLRDLDKSFTFKGKLLERYPIFGSTLHSLYKCFDAGVDMFDYVIVDEGSQVPNYLGLIALRYARHLVLLGDVEQIPPIVPHWRIGDVSREGISAAYAEGADNSFIRTCQNVFELPIGSAGNIMLTHHYRCDPGIIEFCNQYVYAADAEEAPLVPMVRNAEGDFVPAGEPRRVPIRVVWYDGAYGEKLGDQTGEDQAKRAARPKVHNLRQIGIFMEEELPRVMRQVAKGKSACVLSPYRAPVEELAELIEAELAAMGESPNVEEVVEENDNRELFQLTIHRAQGKDYDVVYYLSIDDLNLSEPPWSQQRCLVNVAVSRAREEFCVITSSLWFSERVARRVGAQRPESGWKHERSDQDGYYLKKLLAYVDDNRLKATGEYGFHKASVSSVFEDVPLERIRASAEGGYRWVDPDKEAGRPGDSAPQTCMNRALEALFEGTGYRIVSEERVLDVVKAVAGDGALDSLDDDLRDYVEHDWTRFDMVIHGHGKPIMAIEVDGEPHREHVASIRNDVKKNRVVREALGGATYGARKVREDFMGYEGDMHWDGLGKDAPFALVRIPTNGETHDEDQLVAELLNEFENAIRG